MTDRKERRFSPRPALVLALAVALVLALAVTAYAADWFGFRALLRPNTVRHNGAEQREVSLTQPQDVPEGLDPAIAEKVANSEKAWAEWMAWKTEYGYISKCPEGFGPFGSAMSFTENGDGTVTVRIESETGSESSTVTAEAYDAYLAWLEGIGATYGDYDVRYDVHDAEEEARLEEIAAKYGLTLRRAAHLLWSGETTGQSGGNFLTDAQLAEKTAEMGNSGNIFAETPAGFDKVYWFDEGTFCISYYVNLPSTGERVRCYGYNSMYATLSSGSEVINGESDVGSFAERTHTAPDGTEVTILSNGTDGYIYVYLENSFFAEHIHSAGGMSDADLDFLADGIRYSRIGK